MDNLVFSILWFLKKHRLYLLKIIFVLFVILVLSMLRAEPDVKTSFIFYDIFPISTLDFDKEMRKRSPIKNNEQKFNAYTDWHVKWDFRWKEKNGGCIITKANTSLSVTYRLPRIAKDHPTPPNVRQSFKNYYTALLKHEKNHMRSGLSAAREIENALLNLGYFETCDQLDTSANATANKIVSKYNEQDKEYDRKTEHGKTEGADINSFM
jgi:predicted secreted Zn-dependent protease